MGRLVLRNGHRWDRDERKLGKIGSQTPMNLIVSGWVSTCPAGILVSPSCREVWARVGGLVFDY